ncbi:MAG: PAS domain S-box protein, partial [Nitrospirota bacterium]|nr:PAS domain S-box protein [Nitrospirota bacterium]
ADLYRADDRHVMTSDQPKLDFEEPQTTPDGRKITLRTSKIPLKDSSGRVYGVLGTYEDITERKEVEESLKDSESRYREMFEQTMDYILVLEPVENGPPIIVDASESAFRRHGYSRKEMIGKPITILDPEDAKVAVNVNNILRDGFAEFEVVHKCKDGSTFPARVISRVINIKGRRHFYSVERDISREKLAESQLNVLSTAIEQSPTSIVITDAAGNIDYVNPKFTRLTGYSFDEARGQNPRILKSGAQPSEVYEELWKTIASGEVWRGEFCNKKKNGDLYWERVVISPVKDQAGTITHFLAVKEDITELKKSEGEKKGLEAQLRQAQKMETIGTLAGGIAHDFNNILQPVNSCSEMLRSRLPADSPLMKYVDLMSRSVDRGRDLVKQLLTFSRQKEQEKRPIRLQPIIAETLSMISSLVPATVNIRMEIDQNCRPVMADPIQIQQIIMNLCTNACDAMNKNGTLTVQLEAIELDEAAARDNLRLQSGRYALIVVRDTGDGMDEDTQKRIFDPFFTTKEIGKGTGLGLSVVHGIIMECSGEIVVDSSPGSGTSFKVYLPCTEKIAVEPVVVQGAAMVGGAGTILFVDDEEDITSISREMLEDLGYIVTALNSAADAIEELRRKPDMYDLVISDYAMPAMTGDRFAAEARKICPGIPVILITGNNEAIPAEKLRDIAAREIVSKPFRMQEIGEAISRALNSAQ